MLLKQENEENGFHLSAFYLSRRFLFNYFCTFPCVLLHKPKLFYTFTFSSPLKGRVNNHMKNYINEKEEGHSYFEVEHLAGKTLSAGYELARRIWCEKTDDRQKCRREETIGAFISRQEEAEAYREEIKRLEYEICRMNREKDKWRRKAAELEEELRSRKRYWEQAEIAYKVKEHCLEGERDKLKGELAVVSAELVGEHEEKERLKSSIVRCMNECGVFREWDGGRSQVVYAEYNTFAPGAVQIKGSVLSDARFAPGRTGYGKEAAL